MKSRCYSFLSSQFFCDRIRFVLLIVLSGIIVYSNTLHVPFVLDDLVSIDFLGSQSLVEILLYGGARRFVDVTLALNYKIHGLELPGYHLVNLAIHISTALVLYFIVDSVLYFLYKFHTSRTLPCEWSDFTKKFVPFAVALIFVTHPLQTQAVTYIIQRYTSLATFFYLLSVLMFLRARIAMEWSSGGAYPWIFGGLSGVAAVLAMGSKQISVTLPVILIIFEFLICGGRLINRKNLIAGVVLCMLVVFVVLIQLQVSSVDEMLNVIIAATKDDYRISRSSYFFTQTLVVAKYLVLMSVPLGQSIVHDSPVYSSFFSFPVIALSAFHVSMFTGALYLYLRSRENFLYQKWESGILQRLACIGIIWFYCTIAVESSVFPIRDVMFEHRVYLPSVGYFMAVISLTVLSVRTLHINNRILWIGMIVVCVVLGWMTVARNQLWNNKLLLWQDAVGKNPANTLALANLGAEYLQAGLPEKALPIYVRIMESGGEIPAYYLGNALSALNIYGSRFTTGGEFMRPDGPMGSGILAPEYATRYRSVVFNTLGLAYEYLGETDKAIKSYRSSLKTNAAYDLAWYNLGLLMYRIGDKNEAFKALAELKKFNDGLARSLSSELAR